MSEELWKGCKVRIKEDWEGAYRIGQALGEPVFVEQDWLPVLWADGELDWHKLAGIERFVEPSPPSQGMSEEPDYDCELCPDGTFDIRECPSCCRKIVESRPGTRKVEIRWPENMKNAIEQVLRDKIMIIQEHHHSYYGNPQELTDLLVNACFDEFKRLNPDVGEI